MTIATFNGDTLTIQLPSVGSYDVESELYSAWKEWVLLSDNAKYPVAFETTGGDDIGGGQQIAPYFFCRNDLGWRIKAPQENGEVIIRGNLFPRNPLSTMFVESGGFDAFIRQEVSTRAVVVETGVSGLTAVESSQLDLISTMQTLVDELHKVRGLSLGNPATFTPTSIQSDDISMTITGNGVSTSTVTRNA
tara:strand:- start:62 stop:637 length:576 start_codon:yes stop_codon:yes gene_type:complete